MITKLMDEEWAVLADLLPQGWRQLAQETGAMRRARGAITSPDMLLQLLLLHVATGLSLKQAVARAHLQGLASVSDVALLKRLRSSEGWLCLLARRLFERSRFSSALLRGPQGRQLRAVDATTVEEPGATGTDWRVHYTISLPDLRCDFFEITDSRGAETYKRVPVSPGDIILGDRGYSHREGVAHVMRKEADVIVRLNSVGFPLLQASRVESFGLLAHMRRLSGRKPSEWPVRFEAAGSLWSARLCALRKSKVAAESAKKKLQQVAAKKGKTVLPQTLEFAEYVMVLATPPCELLGTHEILQIYRARWQIELCFKRMKSLLKLGHLPKKSDASARAWIQGKLLTVMLIERLIEEARFFSPWGFELPTSESLEGIHRGA